MKRLLLLVIVATLGLFPLSAGASSHEAGELPQYNNAIDSMKYYSWGMCPAIPGYTNRAKTYMKPAIIAGQPAKFLHTCEYGLMVGDEFVETAYAQQVRQWAITNGFSSFVSSSGISGPMPYLDGWGWPACITQMWSTGSTNANGDSSCGYFPPETVPLNAALNISFVASIVQTASTPDGMGEFYGFIPGSTLLNVTVTKPNGVVLNQPTITSCPSGSNPEKLCASWDQIITSGSKVTVNLDVTGFGYNVPVLGPYVHRLEFYCRTVTGQVRCDGDSRAPIPYGQP